MYHDYSRIISIILLICGTSYWLVSEFIKSVREYEFISHVCLRISDFIALRYSYRAYTQLLNRRGIAENESSHRRSLSLRALACTFPRMDACIRNAGETSRRRRALQGGLTGVPWVLINSRGSISRVTKFHLSDSTPRENARRAYRYYARKHACVYHPQSLILRIMDASQRRVDD